MEVDSLVFSSRVFPFAAFWLSRTVKQLFFVCWFLCFMHNLFQRTADVLRNSSIDLILLANICRQCSKKDFEIDLQDVAESLQSSGKSSLHIFLVATCQAISISTVESSTVQQKLRTFHEQYRNVTRKFETILTSATSLDETS